MAPSRGSISRRCLFLATWLAVVLGMAEMTAGDNGNGEQRNSATAEAANNKSSAEASAPDEAGATLRMREGTKLSDQVGEFQKSGDRYNFYPQEGKGVIRVLENLALERVARVLIDDPATKTWNISGIVTEYRGENFLLITRAVLKSRTPPVVPATPKPQKEQP